MRPALAVIIMCTALAAFVGCASTQPSRFYVLSDLHSMETAPPAVPDGQGPAIGIGLIALPKYLDRPQIATLASRYELNFDAFRWPGRRDKRVDGVVVHRARRGEGDGRQPQVALHRAGRGPGVRGSGGGDESDGRGTRS
jgi:uncharacterized lipoprotein YmbA